MPNADSLDPNHEAPGLRIENIWPTTNLTGSGDRRTATPYVVPRWSVRSPPGFGMSANTSATMSSPDSSPTLPRRGYDLRRSTPRIPSVPNRKGANNRLKARTERTKQALKGEPMGEPESSPTPKARFNAVAGLGQRDKRGAPGHGSR